MKTKKQKSLGFTLIELLVVIAIVGVLSAVVLQSLNSARIKSRDTTRLASIDQIHKALELGATGGTNRLPSTTGYVCLGLTADTGPFGSGSCSPLATNPINTTVNDTLSSNLAGAIPRDPYFLNGIGTAYLYNSYLRPTPPGITAGEGAYLSWVMENTTNCGRGEKANTSVSNGNGTWCFLRIGDAI